MVKSPQVALGHCCLKCRDVQVAKNITENEHTHLHVLSTHLGLDDLVNHVGKASGFESRYLNLKIERERDMSIGLFGLTYIY